MTFKFQFDNLQAFMAMGGHGFYVWFCYIVVVCGFIGLILSPLITRRNFIKTQRAILRRKTQNDQAF